eukprot:4471236-Prymnesium_polylepis.1
MSFSGALVLSAVASSQALTSCSSAGVCDQADGIATDGLVTSTSGRKRLPMSSMYVVAVSLHEARSSLACRLAPRK